MYRINESSNTDSSGDFKVRHVGGTSYWVYLSCSLVQNAEHSPVFICRHARFILLISNMMNFFNFNIEPITG